MNLYIKSEFRYTKDLGFDYRFWSKNVSIVSGQDRRKME